MIIIVKLRKKYKKNGVEKCRGRERNNRKTIINTDKVSISSFNSKEKK